MNVFEGSVFLLVPRTLQPSGNSYGLVPYTISRTYALLGKYIGKNICGTQVT